MPMAYFNRAACIYDMWIILLVAVFISPPIFVAPVNMTVEVPPLPAYLPLAKMKVVLLVSSGY